MRLKLENYRFPVSGLGTKSHVKTALDALRWCSLYCPHIRSMELGETGCALTCELRRHFGIPPHGDKFPTTEK